MSASYKRIRSFGGDGTVYSAALEVMVHGRGARGAFFDYSPQFFFIQYSKATCDLITDEE